MTTICCKTNGETVFIYTTSDDYPYISDKIPSEWKHIARLSNNEDATRAEIEATVVLSHWLQHSQIKETQWPVIEDWGVEQKELRGHNISVIKGNGIVAACTLVRV